MVDTAGCGKMTGLSAVQWLDQSESPLNDRLNSPRDVPLEAPSAESAVRVLIVCAVLLYFDARRAPDRRSSAPGFVHPLMLDANLQAYWEGGGKDGRLGGQIVKEGLNEPPLSPKQAARCLQVMRRTDLAPAWRTRVEEEFVPHLEELGRRLAQIDEISDHDNEPQILFETLEDEAEALTL
jgi:hypothetical protein